MALVDHAEGQLLRLTDGEPLEFPEKEVLDLIRLFASQGHSGSSAAHTVALFERLARYETLDLEEEAA